MNWRSKNLWLMVLVFSCAIHTSVFAQSPTAKEKQSVRAIKSKIDRAGKFYVAKKMDACKKSVEDAIRLLQPMISDARPELSELIQPEYERLQKAHELLTAAGQSLIDLPPLSVPAGGNSVAVSFSQTIAPILIAKCGNCHVNRSRGNFSAASYEALEKSTTIAFGLPQDSRLIEVIESGEMPKGGLKIESAELQLLKDWISQGANFDGSNPGLKLNELTANVRAPVRAEKMITAAKPNGQETVSFGLHIAPILVEHCGQCHIASDPRGNFSQASFQELLKGGDAGSPIVPGKSKSSLLFKRITAGEMPPTGKLDNELIKRIEKWIDEGAKYDGGDTKISTVALAATAKANSQTHEELIALRTIRAAEIWKLAMGRVEGISQTSNNFLVTGSAEEERLLEIAQLLEHLSPQVSELLNSESDRPPVKGNISVFVFDKRYDFSEFGKMVEQREFSKQIAGHWNYNGTDAYASILLPRELSAEAAQVSLIRQIAAIQVASQAADVPRWFADGVGYWAAQKILPKDDDTKSWDAEAQAAVSSMKRPDDFVNDRMAADQSGLVGFLMVKTLKKRSANFNQMLDSMRNGQSFEQAFVKAYGVTVEVMIGS